MQEARKGQRRDPSDFVEAIKTGEVELVLTPDGHLQSVTHENQPAAETDGGQQVAATDDADEDQERIAVNRAEIARLKTLRIGAVNDLHDVLGPWLWVLPALLLGGTVALAVTQELAPIVWLLLGVLLFVPMLVMTAQLERRERSPEARKVRSVRPAQATRPFPRLLVEGIRGAFDRVNVDDRELEDALEPLYEHGCKMGYGFYPPRR